MNVASVVAVMITGVLSLGTIETAHAQAFEFKGLVLGAKSSVQELEGKHGLKCELRSNQYGRRCVGKTTLFDKPGSVDVNLSNEGVITRIYVQYAGDMLKYNDMRTTFEQKFGPGHKKGTYTTEWKRGQGKVEQQWVVLQPDNLELRIVRLDTKEHPARVLSDKARKDL